MKKLTLSIFAAVAVAISGCASTGNQTSTAPKIDNPLTLEQIFTDNAFRTKSPGSVRWLADGTSYTAVEAAEGYDSALEIVRYQGASADRSVLVAAKDLIPADASEPLVIDDYLWNHDESQLLIYTNSKKVWRSNSRGDYWVLDMASKSLKQLGGDAPESSLMFAKFSPQGDRVAYVSKNNLYVESLENGAIRQITQDGNDAIVNGTFDWVYEEEFGIADGFQWSPDGKHIAYWQLDTSPVKIFTMINNTDALYPTLTTFPYPKAGEKNSIVRVGIVNLQKGETTWAKLPETTKDYYIPRMNWAGDSDAIMVQKVNRLQNTNDHYLVDVNSGDASAVYTDKDDAFFEWYYDVTWLDNGQSFLKISERDGWRQVFRISRDGKSIVNITPGDFDIISLLTVDTDGGWVYFTASPENVTQQYLYRARLDGEGKMERLTPEGLDGNNGYQIAGNGKMAVHYHSAFRTPRSYQIVNLPDHAPLRSLRDNQAIADKLAAQTLGNMEFFQEIGRAHV